MFYQRVNSIANALELAGAVYAPLRDVVMRLLQGLDFNFNAFRTAAANRGSYEFDLVTSRSPPVVVRHLQGIEQGLRSHASFAPGGRCAGQMFSDDGM